MVLTCNVLFNNSVRSMNSGDLSFFFFFICVKSAQVFPEFFLIFKHKRRIELIKLHFC